MRVDIDTIDKGFAGIKEMVHRGMTEIARYLFAHPLPRALNRIQVRAIARQRYDREAQRRSRRLHTLSLVPRGAIPDEHDLTPRISYPGGNNPMSILSVLGGVKLPARLSATVRDIGFGVSAGFWHCPAKLLTLNEMSGI